MYPAATRVLRARRFHWEAWALVPEDGPWFLVGWAHTRWGARRLLTSFCRLLRRERERVGAQQLRAYEMAVRQ